MNKQQKGKRINADFLRSKLPDHRLANMSVMVDLMLDDPANHKLLNDLLNDTDILIADFQNRRPLTGFSTTAPFARVKVPIPVKKSMWDKDVFSIAFESSVFPRKDFKVNLDFRLRLFGCLEVESVEQIIFGKKDKLFTKLFVQNITDDGSREDIYSVDLVVKKEALIMLAKDATDGSKEAVEEFFKEATK